MARHVLPAQPPLPLLLVSSLCCSACLSLYFVRIPSCCVFDCRRRWPGTSCPRSPRCRCCWSARCVVLRVSLSISFASPHAVCLITGADGHARPARAAPAAAAAGQLVVLFCVSLSLFRSHPLMLCV